MEAGSPIPETAAVLVVHGIGQERPGYAAHLIAGVERALRAQIPPLILSGPVGQLLHLAVSQVVLRLRACIVPFVGDILAYQRAVLQDAEIRRRSGWRLCAGTTRIASLLAEIFMLQ